MTSNRSVSVTYAAADDIRDILRYTASHWNADQRDLWADQLEVAFQRLAAFPSLGVARVDLGSGLRLHPVGRYIVVYQFDDHQIIILRVLHERMNVPEKLQPG